MQLFRPNLLQRLLFALILVLISILYFQNGKYNYINVHFISGILNQDTSKLTQSKLAYETFDKTYKHTYPTTVFLSYILFQLDDYNNGSKQHTLSHSSPRPLIYHNRTPEYHIYEAINSENIHNWEASVNAYRQAFSLRPTAWNGYLKQKYYQALSQLITPPEYFTNLATLSTSDSTQLNQIYKHSNFTEWISFAEPLALNSCWLLESIRYDKTASELGSLVPIEIQLIDTNTKSHTVSFSVVDNLVPNAGFEWGTENINPIGFEHTIYHEDIPELTHRVVLTTREQSKLTHVALLDNQQEAPKTSFQSHKIPVAAGETYFMGGWIKDSGAGQLGIGWYGRYPDVLNPYYFVRPAPVASKEAWQFIGRIVEIPQVDSIDLTLINYDSTDSVSFDDLFFFKLTPDCSVQK